MSAATPERRPFRVPARGAGDGAKTRLTRARSVGARREGVHDAAFAASIVLRRRTSGPLESAPVSGEKVQLFTRVFKKPT